MTYIVQDDLLAQVSEDQLLQLTDDDKVGEIDATKVDQAIAGAEAEAESYINVKYRVPVAAPIPQRVKDLCVDIAVYRLYKRRQSAPDKVLKAYDYAIAFLKDVAAGRATLGIEPIPPISQKAGGGEVHGAKKLFDRNKLGSF